LKIQSTHNIQLQNMAAANQIKPQGAMCPHGNPAGACPICLGMGGGGGGGKSIDKPKPTAKELGLLTWADLLPAWYAMLAAKQRQEYNAKMDKLNTEVKAENQSNLIRFMNLLIDNKINKIISTLDSKVFTPVQKLVSNTMQAINNLVNEVKNQILQTALRISQAVSENVQKLLDKLKNTSEMFKNALEVFVSNIKDKEKAVKEFIADFANRLRKKLFRIVETANNSMFTHEWKQKTVKRKRKRPSLNDFDEDEFLEEWEDV